MALHSVQKRNSYLLTDNTLNNNSKILALLSVYKCPLDLLFGIPCPLCGATRAVLSAITGRFADAFYYHPLWPLFIIAGGVLVLHILGVIKVKKTVASATVWFLIIALLGCFIIRHLNGSPVVAMHLEDSLIVSLFQASVH